MPQYSVCFQLVNGWLWHCAHWSWMPRKCWAVVSVSLSTERLARKYVTAGLSATVPVAVTRRVTNLSQPGFVLNSSSSHL